MLLFEMSCMTLREATEADVGYFLFCECTAVLLLFWLLVVRDVGETGGRGTACVGVEVDVWRLRFLHIQNHWLWLHELMLLLITVRMVGCSWLLDRGL